MVRTALTIAVVVLETVVLGVVVMTIGLVLPRRWCFDPCFHVWSRVILLVAGVRLTVEGAEGFEPNGAYFFVGNHQSLLDIPIICVVARGHVRFMAKKSLFRIPGWGWILRSHGIVPIDRSSPRRAKESIDAMLSRLADRPTSMILFPEGTRTKDGSLGALKRGAVQVCMRAAMPILPFVIDGSFGVHRRGSRRIRAGRVRVALGKPITPDQFESMNVEAMSKRLRGQMTQMLEAPEKAVGEKHDTANATIA